METFDYPFLIRILYRYGNIFITLLMAMNLIPLAINVDSNTVLIIPIIITLFVIYFTNKFYFMLYKSFPFMIKADDEKLICTDFMFRKKTIMIYYKNIKSIEGGIFEGRLSGIMKLCDTETGICIAFSHRIRNSTKLIAMILSKIDKELYDKKIETLKKINQKIINK
ncbi:MULTISPECIES: hypothetical protein [Ignavibacterium]|jgi:hypothetical protein|uniref:hypothetical protein n=1 Tax=Ignavibacterium TaxID=795750 RepID=UPI0025C0EF80|nr:MULTISPECIES: hypothetical protein [Ignavibacterium]MBI5662801.1 hypothetical protein [Ignavibacterium album]